MYVFVRKDIDFFSGINARSIYTAYIGSDRYEISFMKQKKGSIKQNNNLNKKTPNVKTNAFYSLL